MKFIEVTEWGNNFKHIIPLEKIVDFELRSGFTCISLSSGKTVNVQELESTIKEMLNYHKTNLVNEEDIRTFYEGMAEYHVDNSLPYDDELPF
jgi:hypothetical protein